MWSFTFGMVAGFILAVIIGMVLAYVLVIKD